MKLGLLPIPSLSELETILAQRGQSLQYVFLSQSAYQSLELLLLAFFKNVSTIQAANDATFTLTVTDCNDFPPVFTQSDHSFTISERSTMTTANEIVYSGINVTDQDATAANRMVSYQIVGGLRTTNNWFNIDPNTVRTFYIYKC